MNGRQSVAAPPEAVWAALNDPVVLKAAIPGCQALEPLGGDRFRAVVALRLGPISTRFTGEVSLVDGDPPNGYRIVGEGSGGAAGVAKGEAVVRLLQEAGGTVIDYQAQAELGGKIAQIGGGVVDAAARHIAASFFERLARILAPGKAAQPAHARATTAGLPAQPALKTAGARRGGWPFAVAVAAVMGFLLGVGIRGWDGAAAAATGLAAGLVVVLTAAAAYAFGRRADPASPVVVIDPAVLARLIAAARESGS